MEVFGRFWAIQVTALTIYGVYKWTPEPFLAKIGAKWTYFAILAPFHPCLLIKSKISVHFLVELTFGSFWKILSCPTYSVGDLWGLSVGFEGQISAKLATVGLSSHLNHY